jgi:hypothetical protein
MPGRSTGMMFLISTFHKLSQLYYRMSNVVAQNSISDGFKIFFIIKFGRVHTDNSERFILVLLLYKFQVGQDMHAIDAAIGPKIQQDHSSF